MILNVFLAEVPPDRRIQLMSIKPGDFIWIRMTSIERMHEAMDAIHAALEHIGRARDVAVVVSLGDEHDIRTLGDDEMRRLGWVRKNKEMP